jgi:O-methyltransferase involved in polyketide biosynthesis
MREGRASATAEHNALFRALDSFRPGADRLIDDACAGGFLTFPLSLVHLLRGIDVFEVDHLATQTAKRRVLESDVGARIGRPPAADPLG